MFEFGRALGFDSDKMKQSCEEKIIIVLKVAFFTEKVRKGKMFAKKWGSDN